MATTITGPIKNVGGDLANGTIEFRSPGLRESSAGDALISQTPSEVDVVDGAFTASLEPGPVNVILRLDGITKTLQNIVIPDSGTHTLHSVVTDSVVYAPTVVSAAVTARNAAEVFAEAAETAAASTVGTAAYKQFARNPDTLIAGAVTRDSNGAATSAPVVWPDGTPGTYTALVLSSAFPGAVDSYKITYGSPVTLTFTQPTVTRDSTSGAVTLCPAIGVS